MTDRLMHTYDEEFIKQYEDKEPPWGPLGWVTYKRTYARWIPSLNRNETWVETCKRVLEGNFNLIPNDPSVTKEEMERAFDWMFNMRLLPPGRGLWMSGTDSAARNGASLNNCVSGDTLAHTVDGLVPVRELVGKEVPTLSEGGVYRLARWNSYGEQELFTVVFENGDEIEATAKHEWVVTEETSRQDRVTTDSLVGYHVPMQAVSSFVYEEESYREGVRHGMVFGDGTLDAAQKSGERRAVMCQFMPDKKSVVEEFFTDINSYNYANREEPVSFVNGLPSYFKEVPDESEGRSYVRGFIAGLIATDGYVAKSGCTKVHSSNYESLVRIRRLAAFAGLPTTSISKERDTNPWTGEEAPLYVLTFVKAGVYDKKMILKKNHRDNMFSSPKPKKRVSQKVIAVRRTGRVETVYCCEEPETHTWVAGAGYLTGNCWAVSVEPAPYAEGQSAKASYPFVFAMDNLMLGGGVGYSVTQEAVDKFPTVSNKVNLFVVCDPKHANVRELDVATIPRDSDHTYIRVKDSREGWIGAMRVLIDCHFKNTNYEYNLVIDVSDVRPAGRLIKGFGGKSAGPSPLVQMLRSIHGLLKQAVGRKLTAVECSDMMGYIGKCVVSGNVRRSALLAMGSGSDIDFIEAKMDLDKLTDVRWTANYSIEVNDDFKDFERIGHAIATNGEPGIINLDRFKNYGRFIDGYQEGCDPEVVVTNPCFTGDMRVLTEDGYKTFFELYASGAENAVVTDNRITYSGDWDVAFGSDPSTAVRNASHVELTQKQVNIVKVTTNSGMNLRCTPDHKIATSEGMVEAKDLKEGDKVLVALPDLGESIVGRIPETLDEKIAFIAGLVIGGDTDSLEESFSHMVDAVCGESFAPDSSSTGNVAIRERSQVAALLQRVLETELGVTVAGTHIVPQKYMSNSAEAKYFVAGLMYAAGFVTDSSIGLSQTSTNLLEDMLLVLHANGILGSLQNHTRGSEIVISGKGLFDYASHIGFMSHPTKEDKLNNANANHPKSDLTPYTRVVSVTDDGVEDVFCLSQPETKCMIVNGLSVRNCSEIGLASGEPCCLVELFPSILMQSGTDYEEAARMAYRYAKRVTFSPHTWEASRDIVEANRRIGVSISGWEDWKLLSTKEYGVEGGKLYRREMLEKMYQAIRDEDQKFSEQVGCNPSIKLTTVKPSGSISLLNGSSPGRHAHYAKYYIRRIRLASNDPLIAILTEAGFPVEEDAYSPNTVVAEFPVKAPTADIDGFKSADEYTLEEQCEDQMELQTYWADNSVSSTLTFKPGEVENIPEVLRKYKFKSTSMLPYSDHGYVQAPYEPISEEKYHDLMSKVKFWPTEAHMDTEKRGMELLDQDECVSGVCPIK